MRKRAETKELPLLERINKNLQDINTPMEDEESRVLILSSIVCPFYEGHKMCIGCIKPLDKLEECGKEYADIIVDRPMEVWSPTMYELTVREKVKRNPLDTLSCDTCYFADNCPEFQNRATCSIEWGSDFHTLEPIDQIDVLIKLQEKRLAVARSAELQDGGIPDQNLSVQMDILSRLIQDKANVGAERFSMTVSATGGNSAKAGGGVLAKLFGAKTEPEQPQIAGAEVIKLDANVVDAEIVSEKTTPKKKETTKQKTKEKD